MLCALRQHLTLCKTKPKQQYLAALVDVVVVLFYTKPYRVRNLVLQGNNTQCQSSIVNSIKFCVDLGDKILHTAQKMSVGSGKKGAMLATSSLLSAPSRRHPTLTFRQLKQRLCCDAPLWSLWRSATLNCSRPTPSSRGTRPPPAGTGCLGNPPSRSPPSCRDREAQHSESSSSLNQIYASGDIWKVRSSVKSRVKKKEKKSVNVLYSLLLSLWWNSFPANCSGLRLSI